MTSIGARRVQSPVVEPAELRQVMSTVPTGVMVVTTCTADGHDGRTANSMTSVSLEPALLSVCFGSQSRFVTALLESGRWAVSVLAADQQHLSKYFATRGPRRTLDGVPHTVGQHSGAALLAGAVATMECRTVSTQPAGDHVLFIGEVLALHPGRQTPSLAFYRGSYLAVGP